MELNRTYIIRAMIGERLLTYTAKVISKDDRFVEVIDMYGKTIYISIDQIQSYEEKAQ